MQGLVNDPSFNGAKGRIVGLSSSGERFTVQVLVPLASLDHLLSPPYNTFTFLPLLPSISQTKTKSLLSGCFAFLLSSFPRCPRDTHPYLTSHTLTSRPAAGATI